MCVMFLLQECLPYLVWGLQLAPHAAVGGRKLVPGWPVGPWDDSCDLLHISCLPGAVGILLPFMEKRIEI